ncbi:conjugal transfer protein [Tepidicaulis marinus]|uniref:Conjugal transfer protein n=1 Tax=Tepidicaulis marinus TaxID=1333998 RepID=A0A081BF37_9HYPH|nr:type IV secretory system conjugative DNA transfer family protein [Tepidicaulis marinus]GAK46655.1 conjugal transfer protein [Tepidicaulis marinus]
MQREEQKAQGWMIAFVSAGTVLSGASAWLLTGFNGLRQDHWAWVGELTWFTIRTGNWTWESQAMLASFALIPLSVFAAFLWSPYSFSNTRYGIARWAKRGDFGRMGITARKGLLLGRASGKKLIADVRKETRSEITAGPAGSGKTIGRVVPVILSYPGSLVIADPKNELWEMTAGWRKKLGPVYRVDWRAEGAKFNPIARAALPKDQASLEIRIDNIAATLIPRRENSANPYFDDAPRAFMSSVLLYLIGKAEKEGRDACMGDVLTWAASGPAEGETISVGGEEIEVTDPVGALLILSAHDAEDLGLPRRVQEGFMEMARMNFKERASHFASLTTALSMFKNSSVREATSDCSFQADDLRNGKPATIYVSMRPDEAAALSPITGLLVNTLADNLMSAKPESKANSVLFLIEEMAQLPKSDTIKRIFEFGRSMRVHCMAVLQDFSQLREKYGADGLETFINTASYLTVFSQNSPETRDKISRMIGEQTRKRKSNSMQRGLTLKGSVSSSWEAIALMKPNEIGAIPSGKNILLVQNHHHKPVWCDTVLAYRDRTLRKRLSLPA